MSEAMVLEEKVVTADAMASPGKPAPSATERIHYLDNLRALAMMLGVLLHAGLAYANPAQVIWVATDRSSSVAVDASIWFIHLFRMGLFFLLSGYFAKLVIERKGTTKFVWNRCVRIVAPFVLFYPILSASMGIVFVFALSYLKDPRGLMGLVAAAIQGATGPAESPPATTMHLWFLYYLVFFSAIGALMSLGKLKIPQALNKLSFLWWFAPLVLVPAVLKQDRHCQLRIICAAVVAIRFLRIVLCGWMEDVWMRVDSEELATVRLADHDRIVFALCALLFSNAGHRLERYRSATMSEVSSRSLRWQDWVVAILTAYLSVSLTIASLLLGQRYLTRRSPWLSFFSDSSYWVYLIHLPIVLFLQTLLIPMEWPLVLKLGVVILGTLISCLATYIVFVRYTPLGWLLHGKRQFP